MQNHISKSIIAILFCTLTFVNQANSQAMYEMQNATVNDCEGVLTDSQEGPEPDQYDHNEDYTFTICVEDADEIILNFAFFATEQTFDILTIYEGPDKTGPVIAVLHGVIQPAPSFVIRNECVTLHFVSDDNIVANGWSMTWRVEIDEPKVPEMMITGAVDCPLGDVEIMFNCPVDCDLLDPANFGIIGPGNISVSDITALDCDPQTGEATKFKMSFTDSLRLPGTYRIAFMGQIQDACGEWHDISSSLIFVLSGCPIAVYIETSEWACLGDCGKVRAVIVGGTNNTYTYDWSHTTDNSEEVEICFDDTTTISVTVTDQVSFTTASATYTYYPLPNPNFLNPLGIDTFCSNRGNHTYQVDLAGGEFYSRIIPGGNRTNGLYQFWRWSNRTVTERDIIEYIAPNGCTVYDTIFIKPINAGSHEAACIGSNAFAVNGGRPVGGSWSGNHVSPNGSFDPTEVGEFTITYTAPNGCQASKIVRVTDDIVMPDVDTICGNGRFRLTADPFGGRWAGPQISNNYWGNLEAQNLPPNRSYTYFYNLMGCTDSMVIFIRGIYAGRDTAICVSEDFLVLQDTIGTWTGPGVYIPALKGFDISGLGVGRYDYTLEANGCIDRFRLYIEDVVIEEHQVLEFCQEDYWVDIQNYISIYPSGGDLIAPFLYDTLDTWFFNPSLMGPGDHLVVLEAYDCQDSVWINIEEYATIQDYSFCELESAVNLEAIPAGGTWNGTGILDPNSGLFDPETAGLGFHEITYISPRGCVTLDTIEVFEFMQVSIDQVESVYCFKDSAVQVVLDPPGGEFFINGQSSIDVFNPKDLGPGSHELFYTRGNGACESTDRVFITVLLPIDGNASVTKDSICLGDNSVVMVSPTGGLGNLVSTWNKNLDFGTSHIVYPDVSTWYTVIVEDGCSDPYLDSVLVHVFPDFDIELEEGPEVCYGEQTYVEIITSNPADFQVQWLTDVPITGKRYDGLSGFYNVKVTQLSTGCSKDYTVELPGALPLKANFSLIPSNRCIDIIDNEIEIIDLATGYTDGTINFGDTSATISLITDELTNEYNEEGEYKITQIVTNDLGCIDSFSLWICVENKVRIYTPNIFTPNGDGENDFLKMYTYGLEEFEWSVFDRYGELVFKSNGPDDEWDGNFRGLEMVPQVFALKIKYKEKDRSFFVTQVLSVTLIR